MSDSTPSLLGLVEAAVPDPRLMVFTCTIETCPIDKSFYDYRPSLGMNSALLALFGISLLLHIAQGVRFRAWTFMFALACGNLGTFLLIPVNIMSMCINDMIYSAKKESPVNVVVFYPQQPRLWGTPAE